MQRATEQGLTINAAEPEFYLLLRGEEGIASVDTTPSATVLAMDAHHGQDGGKIICPVEPVDCLRAAKPWHYRDRTDTRYRLVRGYFVLTTSAP